MKTTDQIHGAIKTAQFLIKLVSAANNPQMSVTTDIISSNCNIAVQALVDGASGTEWHYPISNLINDLLVISEDIKRSNLDEKIAIALLFKLTSQNMRAYLEESENLINQKLNSIKIDCSEGISDIFMNLN